MRTSVHASATEKTPIMLTQHMYWFVIFTPLFRYTFLKTGIVITHPHSHIHRKKNRNLDAFNGSENILGHHLQVDSSKIVHLDGDAVPTGSFINVEDTAFDFKTSQTIGHVWNETVGLCGGGLSEFIRPLPKIALIRK